MNFVVVLSLLVLILYVADLFVGFHFLIISLIRDRSIGLEDKPLWTHLPGGLVYWYLTRGTP